MGSEMCIRDRYRPKTSIGRRFGNYHMNEPHPFVWYWPKESFLSNASDTSIFSKWVFIRPRTKIIFQNMDDLEVYPMVPSRLRGSLPHEWMGFIHVVSDTFIQYLRPFGSIPCGLSSFYPMVSDTFVKKKI